MDKIHRDNKDLFINLTKISVKSFEIEAINDVYSKYLVNDAYHFILFSDLQDYLLALRSYESMKRIKQSEQLFFKDEDNKILILKAVHKLKTKDNIDDYDIKLFGKNLKKLHQNISFEFYIPPTLPILINKAKQKKLMRLIEKLTIREGTRFSHSYLDKNKILFGTDKIVFTDIYAPRYESPLLDLAGFCMIYNLDERQIDILLKSYYNASYGVRRRKAIEAFKAYYLLLKIVNKYYKEEKIESNDSIIDKSLQFEKNRLIELINNL